MRLRDTGSLSVVCGMPSVSTAVRVKPAGTSRGKRTRRSTLPVLRGGQTSRFVVDSVLGEAASQQQAYQTLVAPLVDSFIQGENVVLLAYGASASGKSYTLQGGTDMGSLSTGGDDAGMVLRATHAILRALSIVPKAKYCLSVAYCGLTVGHEAQLFDLLAPAPAAAAVSLRDGSAAAALAALTAWAVEDPVDVLEALRSRRLLYTSGGGGPKGVRRGSMHSMLTLQLDSFEADGTPLQRNTLSFVELAAPEPKDPLNPNRTSGSESASARSLAVGYSTLSKVLSALRNTSAGASQGPAAAAQQQQQQQQQLLQHVPWRDSPLTRWLQEQLHAANAILLLGTISPEIEAATDSLTTVSWLSRFSAASRSGSDGVIVSFAWEALADPEAGPGSYIRFFPDPQEDAGQTRGQQAAAAAATAHMGSTYAQDPCSVMCSSPMAKLGSPNLHFCESAGSPRSNRPRSAGSVCQLGGRWLAEQQQQQCATRPESPLKGSHSSSAWHREQQQLQKLGGARSSAGLPSPLQQQQSGEAGHHLHAAGSGFGSLTQQHASADRACAAADAGAAGGGSAGTASAQAAAADAGAALGSPRHQQLLQHTQLQHHQHQHHQQQEFEEEEQHQQEAGVSNEVQLYGELMTVLRRGGGSLRAEAILEQLLQELGAARAALSSERGEGRALRCRLEAVEGEHSGCKDSRQALQEQVVELQKQLEASRKSLAEVSTDRDMFLRRLQQLELEEGRDISEGGGNGGSSGGGSALDMQRQKAHAAQLRMMEAELNALSSSNQQLRSQLELSTQQVSAAAREKLSAQDAAAAATARLQQKLTIAQQEVDMLRAAAEIEAAVRKELEATADELRQALDAAAGELSSLSADKAAFDKQHEQAQESIDALVAELQDTLARLEQEQQQAGQLSERLQQAAKEGADKEKKLSVAQDQVSTLQALVQQLMEKQQSLEQQQVDGDRTMRLLQDLQLVFGDFELDLGAVLPQQWQQLLKGSASDASSISPHSIKLRSRLLSLLATPITAAASSGGGTSSSSSSRGGGGSNRAGQAATAAGPDSGNGSSGGGSGVGFDAGLPSAWAGRLQAVVEVLELAGQERGHVCESLQTAQQLLQLLETNVQELQKLVSTQESLQQELAAQVDSGSAKAQSQQQELQRLAGELQESRKRLDEAQAAAAAAASELQASQEALKAADSSKAAVSSQLATSQAAVAERDAALDALADELVAVSGTCDQQAAAREQAEEQVVNLASELEDTLLALCNREQLLEQIWAQLSGAMPPGTNSTPAAALTAAGTGAAGGHGDRDGPQEQQQQQQSKAAVASALSRTEQLRKLAAQQKRRWSQEHRTPGLSRQQQQQQQPPSQQQQPAVAGLARRLLSSTSAEAAAAGSGIAQAAVAAAMRRSSQAGGDSATATATDGPGAAAAAAQGEGGKKQGYRLQQHQQQQQGASQGVVQQQWRQQEEGQLVVVEAVRQLREQVTGLQQQLQAAQAGRQGCEVQMSQQLAQLQALAVQQQSDLAQAQEQRGRLQGEVVALGQQLMLREQELRQAQLNCQELDSALRELQRQLTLPANKKQQQQPQQQQQQQQHQAGLHAQPSEPMSPVTPHATQARLQDLELQLADVRKQLCDARAAAAEAGAGLAAERAARVAAEDRDAGRQGIMERLAALQGEVEGLHAALLQEKRAVVALRDELGLMATSRDTWRDAAKRSESKLQEAQAAAEQRSTELTRARAEVLQLRQELGECTQQLLLVARATQHPQQQHMGDSSSGQELDEALAAKLATAQVQRREAEDRAADLARKLAAAQARLAEAQQAAGESEADMGSQLYQAQAQLVRAKADLAASRAAAAVAAVARSNEGGAAAATAGAGAAAPQMAAAGRPQPQQQQQGGGESGWLGGSAGPPDRQRSVAAQLEAAEQLVRSMRATAAAALSDSASAGAAAASCSVLSTGAMSPRQQLLQVAGGSRYHTASGQGDEECSSPFKPYSGAAAAAAAAGGSLEQHLQQQRRLNQQQQEEGIGRAGVWGSNTGSKPGSPKAGGWLYNKLFVSKEQDSVGGTGSGAGALAAAAGGGGQRALAQQPRGMGGAVAGAVAGGAGSGEAPCLY